MKNALVIGAGPAGLSAAHRLLKLGWAVTILEQDTEHVGGLARTVVRDGFRFDLGGHRFFTKCDEVRRLWQDLLGSDLLSVPRHSSIIYEGMKFTYPINLGEVFAQFGLGRAVKAVASAVKARILPRRDVRSFEDWVINQFGKYLYTAFFKTYTEKVWGMPGSGINADWAAQRIRGVSMWTIITSFLFHYQSPSQGPRSMINAFDYPRLGAGQMWEALADRIREAGGQIVLGRKVEKLQHLRTNTWEVMSTDTGGLGSIAQYDSVISTMPLPHLLRALYPEPPVSLLERTKRLSFRDFMVVMLATETPALLPEQWLYVHSPDLRVGRIQNLRAWSSDLCPNMQEQAFVMEYFCNEGEDLWTMSDNDLVSLATKELSRIPGISDIRVTKSAVVRVPKAYPVYDTHYREALDATRKHLKQFTGSLQLAGRNGLHRYNNQDHSVMTGFLAAENIAAGRELFDVWRVNSEAEYIEDDDGDPKATDLPRPLGA